MSRRNAVNRDRYTQRGRLTPDEAAAEIKKQRQPSPRKKRKATPRPAPPSPRQTREASARQTETRKR